ncbi:MAG: thioredoxin family protein [Candidatus Planktophila sp.]
MKSLLPIVIVLALATVYGLWYQRSRGTVKAKAGQSFISESMIGGALGSTATLVQFSSAFCTPCRATRVLLENIVANMPDVAHVEVDAEAQLELVRQLNILSTPTTLILNSQGLEVGRAVGAPKREQVINALAAIRK